VTALSEAGAQPVVLTEQRFMENALAGH
jgi:hypothetical protein